MTLKMFFPTSTALQSAPVSAVAGALLKALLTVTRDGLEAFHIRNAISNMAGVYDGNWECARAAAEGFKWLESRGMICQNPGADAGWFILSRLGIEAAQVQDFPKWSADRDLPESLLHPIVAAECMLSFRAGKFDTAVFEAFKALEVRIREGAELGHDFVGVKLASRAFNPEDGRLTDAGAEAGERQALMNLMCGALGYFKNPQSHRKVELSAWEAREMLVIASHLYRIAEIRSIA